MSSAAAHLHHNGNNIPIKPKRGRAAERQRAYRRRKRAGEMVCRVHVADRVIEALLVSGRLSDDASRDRGRVQDELAGILAQWAARWLK